MSLFWKRLRLRWWLLCMDILFWVGAVGSGPYFSCAAKAWWLEDEILFPENYR